MPRASQPQLNVALPFGAAGRYGPAEEELRGVPRLAPDDVESIGARTRTRVRSGDLSSETRAWPETLAFSADDLVWREWAREQLARGTSADGEHPER